MCANSEKDAPMHDTTSTTDHDARTADQATAAERAAMVDRFETTLRAVFARFVRDPLGAYEPDSGNDQG